MIQIKGISFLLILLNSQICFGQIEYGRPVFWSDTTELRASNFQYCDSVISVPISSNFLTLHWLIESYEQYVLVSIQAALIPEFSCLNRNVDLERIIDFQNILFDIAELESRKLRRKLGKQKFSSMNWEGELNEIIQKHNHRVFYLLYKYEKKTDFGNNYRRSKKLKSKTSRKILDQSQGNRHWVLLKIQN